MTTDLSTTSYALLGLLEFDRTSSADGLTGYELKKRSDNTLRFYWVSPAMSQIYTELGRLHRLGLVETLDDAKGRRTTRRYRITGAGDDRLRDWLHSPSVDLPVLKHPVALRLLMGNLTDPAHVTAMLQDYLDGLAEQRGDLGEVRESLGDEPAYRFPAMVADWGLAYYDSEARITRDLLGRLGSHRPPG